MTKSAVSLPVVGLSELLRSIPRERHLFVELLDHITPETPWRRRRTAADRLNVFLFCSGTGAVGHYVGNGHRSVACLPGHLAVIGPEQNCTVTANQAHTTNILRIKLQILSNQNGREIAFAEPRQPVIRRSTRPQVYADLCGELDEWYRELPSAEALRLIDSLAQVVLLKLIQEPSADDAQIAHGDRAVLRVRDILEEDSLARRTIPELAAIAGLSEAHFSRRFKAVTGISPKAYQVRLRMRQARQWLATGASVKEVAARLGYADQFVFSRQFSGVFGVPPSRIGE